MADEILFHVTKDFVFFVTNQNCRQISIIIRIVSVLENVYPVLCRRDDSYSSGVCKWFTIWFKRIL